MLPMLSLEVPQKKMPLLVLSFLSWKYSKEIYDVMWRKNFLERMRMKRRSSIVLEYCSTLDSLVRRTRDENRSYACEDVLISIPYLYLFFQLQQEVHVLLVDLVPYQPL